MFMMFKKKNPPAHAIVHKSVKSSIKAVMKELCLYCPRQYGRKTLCVFLRPKFLADVLRIHGEFVVNLYMVQLILESKQK